MDVHIINCQLGNIRSVANAFEALGVTVTIVSTPEDLAGAEKIVLPGVGSFADGIKNLNAFGWVDILAETVLQKKTPFLGICLGMQLLATKGTENGEHAGLNWIPGTVLKIPSSGNGVRIPHIGWDDITIRQNSRLYLGITGSPDVYFLHSFHFIPDDRSIITATCKYGIEFAASLEADNIFATQFHPEKSQKAGLAILKNFLDF
jgi:imidazole glycerol-phosphate synthase subunit HisH